MANNYPIAEDCTALREEVIRTAQSMNRERINVNKSGNVSVRASQDGRDGFLITPTGIPYADLTADQIVFMVKGDSGWESRGQTLPSSEWGLHAAVYEYRSDVQSVVHTHSLYATVLACLDEGIPPFHYMIASANTDEIRCAPYALFGTEELAESCVATLGEADACLLSHHGVIACGKSLSKAFSLAVEVENLAHMWVELKKLNPDCLLSAEQMQAVKQRFKTYGQQNQ